jgi:hypothetical protein
MSKDFTMFLLKDNPDAVVNESRSVILQAMRGDDIAYDIGPFVIEFNDTEARDLFFENGLSAFLKKLEQKYSGIAFVPLSAHAPSNTENDMVI